MARISLSDVKCYLFDYDGKKFEGIYTDYSNSGFWICNKHSLYMFERTSIYLGAIKLEEIQNLHFFTLWDFAEILSSVGELYFLGWCSVTSGGKLLGYCLFLKFSDKQITKVIIGNSDEFDNKFPPLYICNITEEEFDSEMFNNSGYSFQLISKHVTPIIFENGEFCEKWPWPLKRGDCLIQLGDCFLFDGLNKNGVHQIFF